MEVGGAGGGGRDGPTAREGRDGDREALGKDAMREGNARGPGYKTTIEDEVDAVSVGWGVFIFLFFF